MIRPVLKFFGIAIIERQYKNKEVEVRVKSRRVVIWSHIANILSAMSVLGLAALGVIEGSLLSVTLITSAVLLVLIGILGRSIDHYIRSRE